MPEVQPPSSLQGLMVRYKHLMKKFQLENPHCDVMVTVVRLNPRTWAFQIGVAMGLDLSVIVVPHRHKGMRWVRGQVTIERNGAIDPDFNGTFEDALKVFLNKPAAKSTLTPPEGLGDTAGARSNATETRRATVRRV